MSRVSPNGHRPYRADHNGRPRARPASTARCRSWREDVVTICSGHPFVRGSAYDTIQLAAYVRFTPLEVRQRMVGQEGSTTIRTKTTPDRMDFDVR